MSLRMVLKYYFNNNVRVLRIWMQNILGMVSIYPMCFFYSLQQLWMRQLVLDVISINLERNANVLWHGNGEESIVRCYHLFKLFLLTEKTKPIPADNFKNIKRIIRNNNTRRIPPPSCQMTSSIEYRKNSVAASDHIWWKGQTAWGVETLGRKCNSIGLCMYVYIDDRVASETWKFLYIDVVWLMLYLNRVLYCNFSLSNDNFAVNRNITISFLPCSNPYAVFKDSNPRIVLILYFFKLFSGTVYYAFF